MSKKRWLKILFYLNVVIVTALVSYKVYLNVVTPEFFGVHNEQLVAINKTIEAKQDYSFAVVGNINNSIGIFERRIIPRLNASELDFVISAGNAVSSGGEDKYRALNGTLSHLEKPYLLTFGQHEYEEFGSFRFYDHYGPHFFTFTAGDSRFIFLDSTEKTPWRWQARWLKDLLQADTSRHRFVFIGHPLLRPEEDFLLAEADDYLQPEAFRQELLATLSEYPVDRVFSANVAMYAEQQHHGIPFITTGGAGGLVLNQDESFYHYVEVMVSAEHGVEHRVIDLPVGQHPILKQLESFWFFIHSLFYVGYLNFILLVSLFLAISIKLYNAVFVGKSYYPDYDIDATPWLKKSLQVAMFTNNYLPFIGGVPISIDRLRRGLMASKDKVLIVAPRYREKAEDEEDVVRTPSLFSFGAKSEFRFANIFSAAVRKKVKQFKPDLIHSHHPFWIGSLGVYMARRLKIPVVYTYHTRLEHYSHNVIIPGSLFNNIIVHALVRRFANKCDSVIVPTHSTEEYLRMIGVKGDIYVQPTGIEFERFHSVDEQAVAKLKAELQVTDETVFVSVARLSNEKNIDFMIEALAALKQRSEKAFRFLLIGDGPQRQRLQEKVDSLGLRQQVTLVGSVPPEAMPSWYQLGDVFLFASQSETQGMVILEAMAAGLPVVAVRASGIDDVIKEGANGFKTPARQSLWLDKVTVLLEDPATREKMAQQAIDCAASHSIENFTAEVRTVYAETLARFEQKRNKGQKRNQS
ncbi:glycosyltransferase [Pseudidiomarina sp. 1ASP75-14]|uniref:glycosyltransferase n=1 Tax=Pseudidiomarina terrestris TaxID=2820060 RepID=UPI00264E5F0D|nr:glycosyltransferase [Pseudidiomarina sp. 1ASP75-14]MDN7137229.1 glycosyltransferase [Pseudidiomarina sp. 1ASP75-14]